MDSKSFLASKTLWANIVAFVAVLLGANHIVVDPDAQAALVAGAITLTNIILRLFTRSPVSITGGEGQ